MMSNDKKVARYISQVKAQLYLKGWDVSSVEDYFDDYVVPDYLDIQVNPVVRANSIAKDLAKRIEEEVKDMPIATYPEEVSSVDEEPEDVVNHPSHYNQGKVETIDLMEYKYGTRATLTYCVLNVEKYLSRAPFKGKKEEDEDKAMWYMDKSKELKNKVSRGDEVEGILENILD